MKRVTASVDAIRLAVARASEGLDAMDKPEEYDVDLCVAQVRDSTNEQAQLWQEFQRHLDAGTLLDEVEVYTKTVWVREPYNLVEYWRLLPGQDTPHQLSNYQGYYDFLDAERDRAMEWSDALYVSPACFDATVNETCKDRSAVYRRSFASYLEPDEESEP